MNKIAILTSDIKEDSHSAELFEQVSQRAEAFVLHPNDLQLEVRRNTPIVRSNSLNIYDLDAIIIRRLGLSADTDLQFDLLCRLQQSGVLLVNSCQSLQITESKALTSFMLAQYGFPTVDCLATQDTDQALEFAYQFEDAVIKPLYGQLGQDVYRLSELDKPANKIEHMIDDNGSVIVQRFIESNGSDVRAFVVDDHVSAAIKRQAKEGWKSNIFQGADATKVILDQQLRDMVVKACQIVGLDYCGVDLIFENGEPYILELNGSPAWHGVQKATNKDIAAEVVSAILKKLDVYQRSRQYSSS